MMQIDKKTVEHVALLSRLALDESELSEHSAQLASIVTYISKLNEINTEGVLPTSHALSTLKNVYRKDILKTSLTVEQALQNAPSKEGDFFKVPQIIESK